MIILKWLLFPFSLLYGFITSIRNYLFDIGYKKSFEFEANVIGIGNLTVGGTGKSPMVEYLIRLLENKYKIATLSRGYGRKTKGFRIASKDDNANTIGDEPYQFFEKYSGITVTVGEERAVAIPHILAEVAPDVIVMDDSYQHRYVKPSLNILLCDYTRPFYEDVIMPSGRLRESRNGANRADAIIVTKCPIEISTEKREDVENRIRKYSEAPIFFTTIKYLPPKSIEGEELLVEGDVLLFTGLANPKPFTEYVSSKFNLVDDIYFPDHHPYTMKDINSIEARFNQMSSDVKCIITTEKDMVKLLNDELKGSIKHWPLYYVPIETEFIENGNIFDSMILNSIKTYSN